MYQVQTLNKISPVGLAELSDNYQVADACENPDAILVRSAVMHEMTFGDNLLAIARAGAGVNNIPCDRCAEEGIVVFNTPGANANGVKELAIAGMLLASRDIVGGIEWVQTIKGEETVAKMVEKGKSKFAGTELKGKKLGIIGLGAIGGPLGNAATALGMEVYGCDPYISVDAAWNLSRQIKHVKTRDEIFKNCDFISIHVPLIKNEDPAVNTEKMINADTIAMMKDGVVVLNFARDLLVDDDAMEAALKSGKVRKYVTDFPNAKSANMEGAIAIPHLGASTEEAEDNCAAMAAKELVDYLENGNIRNSVNFPNAEMNAVGKKICVLHKNIPSVIASLTNAVSTAGGNIENMVNASRKEYAYTMMDVTGGDITSAVIDSMKKIDGAIRVRVIG